jgi:hypothetical protein
MERRHVVNGLRAIRAQEHFTATRIGAPGCKIRRQAEEFRTYLDAAIELIEADGPTTSKLQAGV